MYTHSGHADLEDLVALLADELDEVGAVLVVNEPVVKHSQRLVDPQSDQLGAVRHRVRRALEALWNACDGREFI
eukprot:scaffold244945_cov49-Prasinocladus_malaysianus.AAC.3